MCTIVRAGVCVCMYVCVKTGEQASERERRNGKGNVARARRNGALYISILRFHTIKPEQMDVRSSKRKRQEEELYENKCHRTCNNEWIKSDKQASFSTRYSSIYMNLWTNLSCHVSTFLRVHLGISHTKLRLPVGFPAASNSKRGRSCHNDLCSPSSHFAKNRVSWVSSSPRTWCILYECSNDEHIIAWHSEPISYIVVTALEHEIGQKSTSLCRFSWLILLRSVLRAAGFSSLGSARLSVAPPSSTFARLAAGACVPAISNL